MLTEQNIFLFNTGHIGLEQDKYHCTLWRFVQMGGLNPFGILVAIYYLHVLGCFLYSLNSCEILEC
jgi:hypothetical protein